MSRVLDITLPIFATILLGFIVRRTRLLADNASETLNGFVYWIALPALLLMAIAKRPLAETFNGAFIGAFLGSMFVVFVLVALFALVVEKSSSESACMQGFNASLCNTAYIGVPMFAAAYGANKLAPAILGSLLIASVQLGAVIGWLELVKSRQRGSGIDVKRILRAIAKNPLLIAAAAGFLCALFTVRLPAMIDAIATPLGATAGPCALFAMGLFLGGRPLRSVVDGASWKLTATVAAKLVVQPLVAWLLVRGLFPMDPFWSSSTIILSALPTGSLAFVIAQQYGVDVEYTSSAILISTALSIATLSFLMAAGM